MIRALLQVAGVAMAFGLFSSSSSADARRACVAGKFYPADAQALKHEINDYLRQADVPHIDGDIVAALAPHAGYTYSAAIAATVHRAIGAPDCDTVVIIGHDMHIPGVLAALPEADAFETPLGKTPVDTQLVRDLMALDKRIIGNSRIHAREHTVEVHLPFLQVNGYAGRVLPVLFGEPTPENCRAFALALQRCAAKRRIFILASTDLSHYPTYKDAKRLDSETVGKVCQMDVPALFSHLSDVTRTRALPNVQTLMCASGGVGTAMIWAQNHGLAKATVLKTGNSGDVPGGKRDSVVGYAAAVFSVVAQPAAAKVPEARNFSLAEPVQKELLSLARRRIEAVAAHRELNYAPPDELRQPLAVPAAVFVTLHKNGRLRGCIGTTAARDPLWKAVYELARSAAFDDPRFPAVTEREVDELHIEISVLSPLEELASADEIVPKRHGVVVRQGHRSGLFLPQVWDQLPDRSQFLSVLCQQKAHLPADAWKKGNANLLVFTVFAFEEQQD